MPLVSKEEELQNLDDQQTEKEVLTSIFDDSVEIDEQVISIKIKSEHFFIVLRCLLTIFYPSKEPPIFTVIEEGGNEIIDLSALEKELEDSFVRGESVIYEWVVYLKEYLEKLDAVVHDAENVEDVQIFDNSKDVSIESSEPDYNYAQWNKNTKVNDESYGEIFSGDTLTDRKSHFQVRWETGNLH